MPTFILNDETKVNSYGFRVLNSGGNFARFDANPVMTDSHNTSITGVLGSWINRRFDGSNLLADTNFDTTDPNVKPIEDKVNRGFINGASMGLSIDLLSMVKGADGIYNLVNWELMEAAICAIPSNEGSLKLFNKQGALLSAGDIKLSLSHLGLSVGGYMPQGAGGGKFSNVLTPDDFERLSDADKNDFSQNYQLAYKTVFGVKTTYNSALQNQLNFQHNRLNAGMVNQNADYSALSIKTVDDFERLTDAAKLHFVNNHQLAYKQLFSRSAI